MKPTLQLTSVALLLLSLAHPAAAGPIIFDNSGAGSNFGNNFFDLTPTPAQGFPELGVLAVLAPLTANVPITQIQVKLTTNIPIGTHFDFLVFDENTGTINPLVDEKTTLTQIMPTGWVSSPDFSFTLLAGHQYDVGYAANQETAGNLVSNIGQNGITTTGFAFAAQIVLLGGQVLLESEFENTFGSPTIRLEGPSPATAAPEPASLTLLSLGLAGLIGGRIARRRRINV